jgi:uncharacterized protein YjeT (DUF2065 family)
VGTKLWFTGATFMWAVPAFVKAFGGQPDTQLLVAVGGVIMVIGCVMMWLNK